MTYLHSLGLQPEDNNRLRHFSNLQTLQLQPYNTSELNILAAWWSEFFHGDFMFKREKWVQLEGERVSPAVCIGWLSLSPFIIHLNDFPHVILF